MSGRSDAGFAADAGAGDDVEPGVAVGAEAAADAGAAPAVGAEVESLAGPGAAPAVGAEVLSVAGSDAAPVVGTGVGSVVGPGTPVDAPRAAEVMGVSERLRRPQRAAGTRARSTGDPSRGVRNIRTLVRGCPGMEFRQLRTFEAVVRHGTVTRAADVLGMTPSSVSEQIRVLEKSLEVTLFTRGPRGMALTPAGERLQGWARRLLDQEEQVRREVAGTGQVLRLGALETLAAKHVPGILLRLAARRPDLRVEVTADAARDHLLGAVASGDLDAALLLDTGTVLGELGFPLPAAALDFVDLEPVPLVLVAPPGHPLAGADRLTPADLRGERLLVNVAACSFRLAGQRLFGDDVERVRAGGIGVMRAWSAQGLGMTLLPRFAVVDDLAAGTLRPLPLDVPDARMELSLRLVWRADRATHPDTANCCTRPPRPRTRRPCADRQW
ncbi:LysR family transcriptional regulator [Yinghuangia seranimata]|uniref:LysR family transcriptional regulator n=1 Tax=Yinghuangia seranimata TaxID=408067 RepID=UPI00248CC31D|nr:LysR family transcriptional regulator [Yinghuangia seranimata]MDI2129598.1 LysR family transcriptional regulator [Yinghuangia seranimata]